MEDEEGNFCCGCCLGLAAGYMLFGGSDEVPSHTHGNLGNNESSIVEIVDNEILNQELPDGLLLRGIDHYQRNISPKIKEKLGTEKLCRYEPSCSEYAKQAIEKHGSVTGAVMATARLARCNPHSNGGDDPVGTPWYAKKII
jgi:uncharacterized protein